MKLPVSLVDEYRIALTTGSALADIKEQPLYTSHAEALLQLQQLAGIGAEPSMFSTLLSQERRAFGWAFLSGTHGEQVERAFHALASFLETDLASRR